MVAVLVAVALDRGAAQRQPVLLGEEDRAPVDVVQGDQSREQGRQGRVGLPGRQVRPGTRPPSGGSSSARIPASPGAAVAFADALCLITDLVALEGERDRLRTAGGAQLGHRVADVRTHGLRREHQRLGYLGPAVPAGDQPEDLPLPNGERRALAVAASGSVPVFGQLSSVSRPAVLLNGEA